MIPTPGHWLEPGRKAARAAVRLQFDQGFGDELPYADASFDRVFSSFMFHHIPAKEKGTTLRAVRRVLKPGGEFYMMDFEGPQGVHGLLSRVLQAQKTLLDDAELRVLTLMRLSGFSDAKNIGRRSLFLGGVAYYQASAEE